MAGQKCEFEQSFSFTPLPSKRPSFLQDKNTSALLMKWYRKKFSLPENLSYPGWTLAPLLMDVCFNLRSMLGRISAQSYSFDQTFRPYNSEKFALVRASEIIYGTTPKFQQCRQQLKEDSRTPEVISDNNFQPTCD